MPDRLLRDVLAALDASPHGATCFVIAGEVGEGKTRKAASLVQQLRAHRIAVGGIVAPRLMIGERTVGYEARDVVTGEDRPLVRLQPPGEPIGKFFVRAEGVAFAKAVVERDLVSADVVLLDEIGRLEVRGAGHAETLRALLASSVVPVITARPAFVSAACRAFGIASVSLHPVSPFR